MKTLLKELSELEGKVIHSVEIEDGYSSEIIIKTKDDCVLVLTSRPYWERCGEYGGTEIEVNRELGYVDKVKLDLLSEEDIENFKKEQEVKRLAREAEEKRKVKEAEDRVKRSELELLDKLKRKYER